MSDVTIELERDEYQPGETLRGAVCLHPDLGTVDGVEVRIGWHTEGKGDEDRAEVHREALTVPADELPAEGLLLGFAVRLPEAPLSYDGVIVKIRWFVEARVRSRHRDAPGLLQLVDRLLPALRRAKGFRLGRVISPRELPP
jgi:hypothetical protein